MSNRRLSAGAAFFCASLSCFALPSNAQAATEGRPPDLLVYTLMGLAGLLALYGVFKVLQSVDPRKWSISDALSEDTEVTLLDANGKPVPDANGQPQKVTKLVASSSRLIALLGLIGILSLFFIQGLIFFWKSAHGEAISQPAADFSRYLLYGMVMFAPYIVNKFSSIFTSYGPR